MYIANSRATTKRKHPLNIQPGKAPFYSGWERDRAQDTCWRRWTRGSCPRSEPETWYFYFLTWPHLAPMALSSVTQWGCPAVITSVASTPLGPFGKWLWLGSNLPGGFYARSILQPDFKDRNHRYLSSSHPSPHVWQCLAQGVSQKSEKRWMKDEGKEKREAEGRKEGVSLKLRRISLEKFANEL